MNTFVGVRGDSNAKRLASVPRRALAVQRRSENLDAAVRKPQSRVGPAFDFARISIIAPQADVASAGAGHVEAAPSSTAEQVQRLAATGTSGSSVQLPFLDRIQRSFGRHNVRSVQAYLDSAATAANREIGATAFTTGERVAFATAPTLHTAAHEAAHVVQQRLGVELAGGVGQAGDRHERHADAVAHRVATNQSSEALLDAYAVRPSVHGSACAPRSQVQRRVDPLDTEKHGKAGLTGRTPVSVFSGAEAGGKIGEITKGELRREDTKPDATRATTTTHVGGAGEAREIGPTVGIMTLEDEIGDKYKANFDGMRIRRVTTETLCHIAVEFTFVCDPASFTFSATYIKDSGSRWPWAMHAVDGGPAYVYKAMEAALDVMTLHWNDETGGFWDAVLKIKRGLKFDVDNWVFWKKRWKVGARS